MSTRDIEAEEPGLRREGDREVPLGPKARRTRRRLREAAYDLFVTQGYQDTTVAQIADAAGLSLGAFYQYFRDRADVMAALLAEHTRKQVERTDRSWDTAAGWDGVYGVVHSFVAWYAEDAAFAKVWEEVCHIDPAVAELRRVLGAKLTGEVERRLLAGGRSGHFRRFTPKEADLAARALTAMVDRFCYVTYVLDPPAGALPSAEKASELLTDLWSGAIGIPARPGHSPSSSS